MRRNGYFCLILVVLTSFSQCKFLRKEPPIKVLTGLDVLINSRFAEIKGKQIGLVTNHTAVTRDGRHIVDVLLGADGVKLAALYAPEHGIRGRIEGGQPLQQETDSSAGVPVHSLYGRNNKPSAEMLNGIELLMFDIQDVGARFYTYISTMSLAMEAAAENGIPFMVLDRPNPIGGALVEGPMLQPELKSFVGIHEIALRHGLTNGELAKMFNEEGWLRNGVRADLRVIPMQGWRRNEFFTETGLPWIKPSPNMTDPQTALVYPGMCLLEATNISEGRGTSAPFKTIGAPWIDAALLLRELRAQQVPGIKMDTVSFIPMDLPGTAMNPQYEGERCHGLRFYVEDAKVFPAVELGIRLLTTLRRLYPEKLSINEQTMNRLSGNAHVFAALTRGDTAESILTYCRQSVEKFYQLREKYLLYN